MDQNEADTQKAALLKHKCADLESELRELQVQYKSQQQRVVVAQEREAAEAAEKESRASQLDETVEAENAALLEDRAEHKVVVARLQQQVGGCPYLGPFRLSTSRGSGQEAPSFDLLVRHTIRSAKTRFETPKDSSPFDQPTLSSNPFPLLRAGRFELHGLLLVGCTRRSRRDSRRNGSSSCELGRCHSYRYCRF